MRCVQASALPLSIIIVGIGSADFEGSLYLAISLQSSTVLLCTNDFVICCTIGNIF